MRIVNATVLAEPGGVLLNGEIDFDETSGLVRYLGATRGPANGTDLDGAGRIVLPGLTNGHTHSAMTLLRGYSDDVPLQEWLTHMRAFELRMTHADVVAGLRLAMVEMLKSGTVGFIDMFAWNAPMLAAVSETGMRVNACFSVFGYDSVAFPGVDSRLGRSVVDDTPALAAEFAGDSLIRVSYGLHAPYTCSPDLIADVAGRAVREELGVQIHLSETRFEVAQSMERFGCSPIRHASNLGLLDADVHIAHAVHPVDGDLELLARPNVTVSHNPVSNLKLGAGVAPVPAYRDAGIRLALGTDSVASNNTLDLFEEIKTGTILQRGVAGDPAVLAGADVFGWATRGGALAAGAGGTGRIRVGEPADLVVLDTTGDSGTPLYGAESFVYYAARGADVTDVFIAGRHVVRNRRLVTLDEEAVRADVRARAARIVSELASE
jgi:5-methylthioadenosine/S-adenosylhomocysteine deaminase